ncbi:MAG: hypothetical protein EBS86_17560, partial [Crocinitomicaceae bacterium]|nr:hypothetical protein [Crocinitomicaceae bacterium]
MATKLQITNYKHNNASSMSDDGNPKLIEYNVSNSPQIPKYGEIPQIANLPFNKSPQPPPSNSIQNNQSNSLENDEEKMDSNEYSNSFFNKFEVESNSQSNSF